MRPLSKSLATKTTRVVCERQDSVTHEELDEADLAVLALDHVLHGQEAARVSAQRDPRRQHQRLDGRLQQGQPVPKQQGKA